MGMLPRFLFVMACYVGAWGSHGNQTDLLDKLFENYRTEVRPLCGEDVPIEVKVGIAVRQVIDLDEPKQIMTVNLWIRLIWYDCQLTWNASEYGGIETLVLPYDQVWIPDITLYDNAAEKIEGFEDYRTMVSSDGTVRYNFPTVIESLCLVDVTSFPFDTQTCPLPFGSWSFHGFKLNVTNSDDSGDTSSYKVNSEWDLVSVPVERHVMKYSCCPEPYPDVTFYVTLRRKPLFYLLNLIFPCILTSAVALLGFLLPPDSGEKVSLEITVLLALSVFMLVVADALPPTSESFPLIGIYFCVAMFMVTVSTVLSVIVVNVHYRGQLGHRVPRWLRNMFLGRLARFLCVQHDGTVHPIKLVVNNNENEKQSSESPKKFPMNGISMQRLKAKSNRVIEEKKIQPEPHDQLSPLTEVLKEQLTILERFDNERVEKEINEKIESEWKTVAVVMDRLFLVVFTVLLVSCTVGILVQCTKQS